VGALLVLCSEISLGQTINILGTVSLPDTSNWSGITVTIGGQNLSAVTDTAGNFEIDNVSVGTVSILAGKLFYGSVDTVFIINPEESTLTVQLQLTTVWADTFRGHSTPNITTASTNIGNIGVPDRFIEPTDSGFTWMGLQQLKEGSLMIGVDTTRVSDAARFILGIEEDNLEHNFSARSDIITLCSGPDSTVTQTAYDDSRANAPPGIPSQPLQVLVTQKLSTYGTAGDDGYAIVQLDILSENHLPLQNLLVGWFVDWNVGNTSPNRGSIINISNEVDGYNNSLPYTIEIAYQRVSTTSGPFMGVVPLSQAQFHAARIASVAQEIAPTAPNGGFTKANKYDYMNLWRAGNPNGDFGIEEDLATVASVGGLVSGSNYDQSSYTLTQGQSIEIGFALVGGADSAGMVANALNAQAKWRATGHTMAITPTTWSLDSGWNMISLPLNVTDPRATTLFPWATSSLFRYDRSTNYTSVDSILPPRGYWLKFPADTNVHLNGTVIMSDTVPVVTGWNMVGSISYSVDTSTITTVPAGIISAPIYAYNHAYYVPSTFDPLKGYWVKVRQPGVVILHR
jgi:hypothetical protein